MGIGRVLALACAAIATAAPVHAGPPVPEGATFTVFTRPTVTRFPDVAYDTKAGAYLVVSGQGGVSGQFVEATGPAGNVFDISTDTTALSPRVASNGDGFLTCWLVEAEQAVKCRSVKRLASGPQLGSVHTLDTAGAKHGESAPSLACAVASSECLVTWADSPSIDLRG